jgi:hypothetical protein
MQCQMKDTGLSPVHLIISDLFFPAAVDAIAMRAAF